MSPRYNGLYSSLLTFSLPFIGFLYYVYYWAFADHIQAEIQKIRLILFQVSYSFDKIPHYTALLWLLFSGVVFRMTVIMRIIWCANRIDRQSFNYY